MFDYNYFQNGQLNAIPKIPQIITNPMIMIDDSQRYFNVYDKSKGLINIIKLTHLYNNNNKDDIVNDIELFKIKEFIISPCNNK